MLFLAISLHANILTSFWKRSISQKVVELLLNMIVTYVDTFCLVTLNGYWTILLSFS